MTQEITAQVTMQEDKNNHIFPRQTSEETGI